MRRAAAAALVAVTLGACRWTSPPDPKLRELEEILASKNDNDPRLDSAFDSLSGPTKRLFREKYRATAPERRAERGMIVYLLGRNLAGSEDFEFMREVVAEPPCLSLADCSKAGPRGEGDEVTLAYPALVALRQAVQAGGKGSADVVAEARRSVVPAVKRAAGRLAK